MIIFMESSVNLGGQELQILDQMQEINLRGISTLLLCKKTSKIASVAISRNLKVQFIRFRNAFHLPSIFKIIQLLIKVKPIAIVLHSGHDAVCGSLSARIVGLFYKRPKIIRARTYQPGIPNAFPYNHLFDITFTPSSFLRNQLLQNPKIHPQKIQVLYPGINFNQFESSSNDLPHQLRHQTESCHEWIFHAAMLRAEKGHEIFLRALPKILKSRPVKYLIAGDGPLKKTLEKLTQDLNLQQHVYFLGSLDKIGPVLKKSTIAVMPSSYEPLGMFQIESLYNQIPVIASDVGGIPETIENFKTGLLVEPDNTQAWEDAVLWAFDHLEQMKQFAQVGKGGLEKFSIKSNINQLLLWINRP